MKAAHITQLIDFDIREDHISTPDGRLYFFRYFPVNNSILTDSERRGRILQLQRALDSIVHELTFLAVDKVEDLRENKEFYRGMDKEYFFITSDIINSIESAEVSSTSVQRAFYILVREQEPETVQRIYNTLRGMEFNVYLAQKGELALMLRNYLLREFLNFDIHTLEKELGLSYDGWSDRAKKKTSKDAYFKSELSQRLTPLRMDFQPRWTEQNGFFRQTIMVKNIPSSRELCRLNVLAQLKNTTFTMRLAPMDEHLVRRLVDNQMKNKKVKASHRNFTQTENAKIDEDDLKRFYREVAQNRNKIYYMNIYIEMYGKTKKELQETRDSVDSILKALNFTAETLTYYQDDGFLSVSPIGKDCFPDAANNLPTNTLAALYPFSYSGRIDPEGMLLGNTVDGGNMFLDFWQRGGGITNGNYSLAGQSGQGKSYLQKKIISMQVIAGTWAFVFDPDDEYVEEIQKLGGTVVNCADGKVKINPFEVRRLKDDGDNTESGADSPAGFDQAKVFFQHLSWLQDFFLVLYPHIRPDELDALMELVRDVYRMHDIGPETDFSALKSEDYITYTDVYEYIYGLLKQGDSGHITIPTELLQRVARIIKDSYDGSLGFLLNGHTNIPNANLIDFALGDLLTGAKSRSRAILFNIMTWCWNRISRREHRIMLALDEMELLISSIIGNYVKDFSKRARKYDAIIGTVMQNISAVMREETYDVAVGIFANTAFKFVFYPGDVDFKKTKELLQLTDGEAERISVPNQRHCLLKAGADKYYMQIGTLPYEDYLFGKAGGR